MDIHHLIKLANNIGSFFESEPDKTKGAQGVATQTTKAPAPNEEIIPLKPGVGLVASLSATPPVRKG